MLNEAHAWCLIQAVCSVSILSLRRKGCSILTKAALLFFSEASSRNIIFFIIFPILDNIPKVTITLTFQRRSGYYILQIYIPSLFLVLLSWLSFIMQATDIANRLALEVTMVLSIVFLLGNSNTSLPHLSYAKASDVFIIVSFGFIFMALLQTMLTYHLTREKGLLKYGAGGKSNKVSALVSLLCNIGTRKQSSKAITPKKILFFRC